MILFTSSSPDNSRCLPFSSSSSPSLFTYKQIGWTQCAIVCCHNNFSKQFTSTTQGHKILMLWNSWKQVPKVNKFFNTTERDYNGKTVSCAFSRPKNARCTNASQGFLPRKYNILLPPDGLTPDSLPSPPKSVRADGVRWRHNQNFWNG